MAYKLHSKFLLSGALFIKLSSDVSVFLCLYIEYIQYDCVSMVNIRICENREHCTTARSLYERDYTEERMEENINITFFFPPKKRRLLFVYW